MSCLDHWRPSDNCAFNPSTWLMREPPNLIEPEKAFHYHCSIEPGPPQAREAMSNKSIVPHENDVLMGRGGKNNQHIGNEKLRGLARIECEKYRQASKKGKSYISRELVKRVREMIPPGRFLKRNQKTGEWEDVGDEVGREKASQVLRDAVSAISGQAPGGVTKNVSESADSSDHEGHEPQHDENEHEEARKRQRSESVSTAEWPAPPRMAAAAAPSGRQHHQIQPESYPVTPVSPSRTKRQRTLYYPTEVYSPESPPSPSISPYAQHQPEALLEHPPHLQIPPPPPPPMHHYSHHHPRHHPQHHQQHHQHMQHQHMQLQQHHQYEYQPSMPPPPSHTEYSVPPIPLRAHSSYPPPHGYAAVWSRGSNGVHYAPGPPPLPPPVHSNALAQPAQGPDVNEFELFQGELLESDDEGKHPDIRRSDSF